MPFEVRSAEARGILSATSGFIREAGFTHSLTPARNCTFGCSYCYVPTMGIFGGLKTEDVRHWGQFTTFKSNAAELLARALRPEQVIYCSPVVDPYQPAEAEGQSMPGILKALIASPPRVFTLQTRGPLVLRDLELLQKVAGLRVSFSLTTDREDIRRIFEPHCASISERLETMKALRDAGIRVHATLAPVLPCDPERLIELAVDATDQCLVVDPLHNRASKPQGATTREAAARIAEHHGYSNWLKPEFQAAVLAKMVQAAHAHERRLAVGTEGFAWLAQ